MNYKIIAVDFDGTLCENKWPDIGDPNLKLIEYLKEQRAGGDVKLILWTCRVSGLLYAAIVWCYEHGLCFDYVNENTEDVIKEFGSDCRKIFAHEYYDDRTIHNPEFCLPYVVYHENTVDNASIQDLDFETFERKYNATILMTLDGINDRVIYKFIYNKTGYEWTMVLPGAEVIGTDTKILEHRICRSAIQEFPK